jgi:hypothetical protein
MDNFVVTVFVVGLLAAGVWVKNSKSGGFWSTHATRIPADQSIGAKRATFATE